MKIIDFFKIVGKLKSEKRKGWIQQGVKTERIESVADHVFMTTLITLALEDHWREQGLDANKMIKMALIHDLPEALTGDITPRDNVKNKVEKEK